MSFTTLLGLFGSLQGFVLAGAVGMLKAGDSRKPNLVLAALLFIFSVNIAAIILEHAGLWVESIWLILVEYTVSLLFAPVFWYYTNVVLGTRPRIPLVVHMIPTAVWIAYLFVLALSWTWTDQPGMGWLPPILAIVLYLTSYTICVAIRLWRRRAKSAMLVSHGTVLSALTILLLILHSAQFIRYFFSDVEALTDIVPVVGTVIVYIISILAFRKSRLFAGYEPDSTTQKYATSTLLPERSDEIAKQLREILERDKPYMNENLNLSDLAARLAIPRAHLSQVINANLATTFPQMVNEYRVKEALRLLEDPAFCHLTVEAIGYQVGFRSRSGFHTAFKKITGKTPAQVRSDLS